MSTGQANDALSVWNPTPAGACSPDFDPAAWLQPLYTPLTVGQNDLFLKFAEALHEDQIGYYLTQPALGDYIWQYECLHSTRPSNCPKVTFGVAAQWASYYPPGLDEMVMHPQSVPQAKTFAKGKAQKQQNQQNGEEGETEEDKDEKKMDKDFREGDVWFSNIREWHQLQLAYSAGKRDGEAHGATETKWKLWVDKWRLLRDARNKIIVLRKELGTLDKTEKAELDKIDKQEKDGNDQNSSAQKNKVKWEKESKAQALQKNIQTELTCIDEQKLLPEENAKEDDFANAKTLWDSFKQQHPPSWEVVDSQGEVEDEPIGTEWWKGRVLELSKNVNVHMISKTKFTSNPYTVAIQEEIKHRNNEAKERIFRELKGSVTELVKHADGHHVLKEVLNTAWQKEILFIKEEILAGKDTQAQCAEWERLARQRWGCRVLNQMLLMMEKAAILDIIECLVADADDLAKHKFGHWVIGQLVENQRFWEEEDDGRWTSKKASLAVVEQGKKLITKLTASVKTLMTPDKQDKQAPAANNQPASTAGSKKSNTNADCNGAAVLEKAMRNTNIPVDLSKLLYSSVLEEANHEVLAEMGCTRFGVEAAKRALGAFAEEDGMDEDRVEPSQKEAALAYLAQESVVCKLKPSRYGRVLNGFVQKKRGGACVVAEASEGSDEGE